MPTDSSNERDKKRSADEGGGGGGDGSSSRGRRRRRRRRKRSSGKSGVDASNSSGNGGSSSGEGGGGSGDGGAGSAAGPGLRRRVFDASSTTERADTGRAARGNRSGRNRRRGGRRGGRSNGNGKSGAQRSETLSSVLDAEDSTFGQTWWGKRWLKAVEGVSTAYANRLPRGLSYAQSGRVKNLKVTPGRVETHVSGRRASPYKVSIQMRQLTNGQWKKVIEMLANRAAFAASLLAGEMPERITDVFEQCGLSVFPQRNRDIKASCNCPDWANPCKHIAATHYVIGEALDSDPFLLLTLRGRSRDDVLTALRAARSGEEVDDEPIGGPGKEHLGLSVGQLDAGSFFSSQDDLSEFRFHIAQPETELPVLRRLGSPMSWTLEESLADLLVPVYRTISEEAEALGLRELGPRPPLPPELDDELETEDDDEDEPTPEQDAHDESRRVVVAASGAEVVAVVTEPGTEPEGGDDGESRSDGPTVLVRRRAVDVRAAGTRRTRDRRRKDRRDGEDDAGTPPVVDEPAASAVPELEAAADGASAPRLSRRVVPGTTDSGQAPTLEDRLEIIIPITESMPDGPQIARQIIWALKTHGPATARQLARRTRMKKTAVLQLLQSLLAVGLVVQDGQGERARYMAPDT